MRSQQIQERHLIAPNSVDTPQEPVVNSATDDVNAGQNQWIKTQNRVNKFWGSFWKEYLSILHQRAKWRKSEANIAIGDLVIIVDESLARNHWKLGRIEDIHSVGAHVRTVDVRRGDGKILPCDRSKIVKLEME